MKKGDTHADKTHDYYDYSDKYIIFSVLHYS